MSVELLASVSSFHSLFIDICSKLIDCNTLSCESFSVED